MNKIEINEAKEQLLNHGQYKLSGEDLAALNVVINALEQESCDNTISRKLVISLLQTAKKQGMIQISIPYLETFIEQLPSANPTSEHDEWILVSEKLPEESGFYLVAYMSNYDHKIKHDIWLYYPANTWVNDGVIAWRTIPEFVPYRTGNNETIKKLKLIDTLDKIWTEISEDLTNMGKNFNRTQSEKDCGICIGLQMALSTISMHKCKIERAEKESKE